MNTKYKYSAAARRRRQRKIMRRRITCLVVSAGIIVSSAYTFNQYHKKSVQALQSDIDKLNQQVIELTTRNQELSTSAPRCSNPTTN